VESSDEWIVIGEIIKPFGLKGGLKVRPLTDQPDRFRHLDKAVLEASDGTRQTCTVKEVRTQGESVTLFCDEIDSLERAERLVGGNVRIPISEAVRLPKDSYFQHDLVGLGVYLEDGRHLGIVESIWPTGGNDVLVVRDGQRERLIPAVKSLVVTVDLAGKRMVLRYLEGLLEL